MRGCALFAHLVFVDSGPPFFCASGLNYLVQFRPCVWLRRRLEFRQSTESLSLTDEKALLKQMSELRAMKSGMKAATAAEERAKRERELSEASRKELYTRLNEKGEELRAVAARVTAQKEVTIFCTGPGAERVLCCVACLLCCVVLLCVVGVATLFPLLDLPHGSCLLTTPLLPI